MSKFHHVCSSLTGLAHWARRFTHLLHDHLESSPRHTLTKVSPVFENMSRRYDSRSAGGSLTSIQLGHLRPYKKRAVGTLVGTTECRHLRPQSHFPRVATKPTQIPVTCRHASFSPFMEGSLAFLKTVNQDTCPKNNGQG